MLSEKELEQNLQDLIIEICTVMQSRGYTEVSVGAIMRLVGVDPVNAGRHDDDMIDLGEDFDRVLQKRISGQNVPSGTTLH